MLLLNMESVSELYRPFDIYVLCFVVSLNLILFLIRPKFKLKWYILLPWFLIFFYFIPNYSANNEARIFHEATAGTIVDGFETLYIFGRWFMYWGFGLVQLLLLFVLTKINSKQTSNITSVSSGLERDSGL